MEHKNLIQSVHKILFPIAKFYWFIFRPKTHGVKCVIRNNGKILMIRNTYGRKLWSFPGGGIRGEETAEDAVKRETMEEVGIRIENPQEIGIFTSQLEFKRDTVTVFKADALSRNLKIDPIEILEAEWFSPDNLPIVSGYAKKIMSMWNNKEV